MDRETCLRKDLLKRKEALFNPDCRLKHLLNSIREQCKCELHAQVDLCEVNGRLKNLPEHPAETYATKYLSPRETYVLIQVEKQNDVIAFKPLLKDKQIITAEFLENLKKEATNLMPRSPGEKHNNDKRNSLKLPGRSSTPVRSRKNSPVRKS